tara:strand:- start:4235 stop:5869 length:1635 start_codon:yes stop_codon:yes gene_type:complete
MKMKTIKQLTFIAIFSFIALSCEQESIMKIDPTAASAPTPSGTAGTADFTKFSAIGGSYVAGFTDGTLYTNGQKNSLAAIIANQINYTRSADAQATYTFNQPDINSENGYINAGTDGIPGNSDDNGRMYLGTSASTGETGLYFKQPGDAAAMQTPYAGDKIALNNFAFGNSVLGHFVSTETGGPNPAHPLFNNFYARFGAGGSASPLTQFLGTAPSFWMAWLGASDFVGYAAKGGDVAQAPKPDGATLSVIWGQALTAMISSNQVAKGIVGTVPDILALPYFNFIVSNAIPLDAANAAALNAQLGAGFNGSLNGLAANAMLSAAEAAQRQLTWAAGQNYILINDESLTDLGPLWDVLVGAAQMSAAQRAGLEPYRFARQATDNDKAVLAAQGVLGLPNTAIPGDPTWGVSWPLSDEHVLTATELVEFETARATLNAGIKAKVKELNENVVINSAGLNRLAMVDLDGTYAGWATNSPLSDNGVVVTYDFSPPTGMWSFDAVHPNARGYALLANKWIEAINAHFGSSIPKAQVGWYPGPALPEAVN